MIRPGSPHDARKFNLSVLSLVVKLTTHDSKLSTQQLNTREILLW